MNGDRGTRTVRGLLVAGAVVIALVVAPAVASAAVDACAGSIGGGATGRATITTGPDAGRAVVLQQDRELAALDVPAATTPTRTWTLDAQPGGIVAALDGTPWFESTDPAVLDAGGLRLCVRSAPEPAAPESAEVARREGGPDPAP